MNSLMIDTFHIILCLYAELNISVKTGNWKFCG